MKILTWLMSLIYYLICSFKMYRAGKLIQDDVIYQTANQTQINVYHGKKSENDFVVKYLERGRNRERTPAHIHLIVEMYVKFAYNPQLTFKLKEHILQMMKSIKPINDFPPKLQYFSKEHIKEFLPLNHVGEYDVEFLLVTTELLAIQEKTNYPMGSLTEKLYSDFGVKDRFSVIQKAVLKRIR